MTMSSDSVWANDERSRSSQPAHRPTPPCFASRASIGDLFKLFPENAGDKVVDRSDPSPETLLFIMNVFRLTNPFRANKKLPRFILPQRLCQMLPNLPAAIPVPPEWLATGVALGLPLPPIRIVRNHRLWLLALKLLELLRRLGWLLRSWLVWRPVRLLLGLLFGRRLCGFLPQPLEPAGGPSRLKLPCAREELGALCALSAPFGVEPKYQMLRLPGSSPVPATMKSDLFSSRSAAEDFYLSQNTAYWANMEQQFVNKPKATKSNGSLKCVSKSQRSSPEIRGK